MNELGFLESWYVRTYACAFVLLSVAHMKYVASYIVVDRMHSRVDYTYNISVSFLVIAM